MRTLDIALKDIRQIFRDRKSALFLVVMPILFTMFFGFIYGPQYKQDQPSDPRLPVGWVNKDQGGLLSGSLEALLNSSDVIRPVPIDSSAVAQSGERVTQGELAAIVSVPAGYSQAILDGKTASLQVTADQLSSNGRAASTAMDTLTGRLLGAVESAHLSVQAYQDKVGFQDDSTRQAYFQQSLQAAVTAWQQPPLSVETEQATGKAAAPGTGIKVTGFTQSSAGMMVMFAMFGLITSSMVLVLERKTRCLERLLTTPVRRAEVIGGHILAMFLVGLLQELLLVLFGQLAFGVDYLREPAAILLMIVVLAVWSASLGLLVGAITKKEEQVVAVCLVVMFIFSALGGAWFPLDVAGKTFSTIGHIMPTAWAMDGFQNIVMRGLGFSSVLLPAGLLLAYAVVFYALALWRFKFE